MNRLFYNNSLQTSLNPSLSLQPNGFYQTYNPMVTLHTLSSALSSHEQALRAQLYTMMQMREQLLNSTLKQQQVQYMFDVKSEDTYSAPSTYSVSPVHNVQSSDLKLESAPIVQAKPSKTIKKEQNQREIPNFPLVKAQMEEMINFLLNNLGKIDQAEIEKARRKYAQNIYLIPIFDSLVTKYVPVKKHREDIVRYVVRRAFKYLKNETIQKEKIYGKRAYASLCKKYFPSSLEALERSGVNIEDEKELIEFLLPYRKNSKNRTMNNNFTSEIFASQEFCRDYQEFLSDFDKVLTDDNNKKIQKLISLAEECIINNCPEKIKQCSRLPWLSSWIEKTKEMAAELPHLDVRPVEEAKTQKKMKVETVSVGETLSSMVKLEGKN